MPITKSKNAGNSGAEEQFVQLFCDAFGAEKGQYVYLQHPFIDIYGNHRTIDFAVITEDGKIAFEIDGETWHDPGKISEDKYADDLLKQNSMIYGGWDSPITEVLFMARPTMSKTIYMQQLGRGMRTYQGHV